MVAREEVAEVMAEAELSVADEAVEGWYTGESGALARSAETRGADVVETPVFLPFLTVFTVADEPELESTMGG